MKIYVITINYGDQTEPPMGGPKVWTDSDQMFGTGPGSHKCPVG